MKWYDVLAEDRFLEYFSNQENEFYHLNEDGNPVLAPTFLEYKHIVRGMTIAWNCNALHYDFDKYKLHIDSVPADIRYGFLCCVDGEMEKGTALHNYWQSVKNKADGSPYSVDPELLTGEQIAVLIMYPFWSRMGGSFETQFLDDGRLLKYIKALKKKCEVRKQKRVEC